MKDFEYFDPTSVGEAVALLRQHAGSAKVLAGGTDLFLRMHRRVVLPDVVVDLKRIAELAELRYSAQDGLRIGARGDRLLPNHRFERAVTWRWLCAASALRYSALASHWTRLRAAAQPHR